MKSLLFLSACALVLTGIAGCAPTTPATARVALDCPSDQGDLKLSSTSPDRKTCLYSTRQGDQVSLRLIAVSGSYTTALQPIEEELQGEVETGKAPSAAAKGVDVSVTTTGSTASAAASAAKQASDDAHGSAKSAHKASDGDKGDADDDRDSDSHGGDHAHIDLPGIHINADDDKANVDVGGVHVDAGENGATVRMFRDVRLRGEALSREKRGFRSTYILARDDLKDGWKSVGYEAAGPKSGPIVVAVFKAHEGARHDVSDDVKRLVRKNGGV